MWIARNKDGRLKLYVEKPVRAPEKAIYESQDFWHISDLSTNTEIAKMGTFINNSMYPHLKWENDPVEVNLFSNDMIDDIKAESYQQGYEIGYDTGYANCDEFNSQFHGIGND